MAQLATIKTGNAGKANFRGFSLIQPGRDDPRGGVMIRCSNCSDTYTFRTKNLSHALLDEFVEKKFREAGWHVNGSRNRDLCPRCFRPKAAMTDSPSVATPPEPEPEPPPPAAKGPQPEKKYRKLTPLEVVKIADLLRTVAKSEGGFCVYNEGWDDARLLAECGIADVGMAHVTGVRRNLLGNVNRPAEHTEKKSTAERLAALEKRVDELERAFLEK